MDQYNTEASIYNEIKRHFGKNHLELNKLPDDLKNQEIEFYTLVHSGNSVEDSLDRERAANHNVNYNSGIKKKLREINILTDGDNGGAWKNTEEGFRGLNKLDTLKKLILIKKRDRNTPGGVRYLGGAMKNQEVKKCEKKKVVLGKERCIYKVSGSKKDYMKYKGKLVPVTDYVKYMKKKN